MSESTDLVVLPQDATGRELGLARTYPGPRYEHIVIEAPDHKTLVVEANALWMEGWQMVTTDCTTINRIWLAVFVRERIDGVEPRHVHNAMGERGVLAVAGGPN